MKRREFYKDVYLTMPILSASPVHLVPDYCIVEIKHCIVIS